MDSCSVNPGCPSVNHTESCGTHRRGFWPHPDGRQVWGSVELSRKIPQWVACKLIPERDMHMRHHKGSGSWVNECEFEAEGTARVQTRRSKIAWSYSGTGKGHMQPDSGGTGGQWPEGRQEAWQGLWSSLDFILMAKGNHGQIFSGEATRWGLPVESIREPGETDRRFRFPLWPHSWKGQPDLSSQNSSACAS